MSKLPPETNYSISRLAVIRNLISSSSRTRSPPRNVANGLRPSCSCVTVRLPVTAICTSPKWTDAGNDTKLDSSLTMISAFTIVSASSPDHDSERMAILGKSEAFRSSAPNILLRVPSLALSETSLLKSSPSSTRYASMSTSKLSTGIVNSTLDPAGSPEITIRPPISLVDITWLCPKPPSKPPR